MSRSLLTALELETLASTAELSRNLRQIIGEGRNAANDWAEAALHIHNIQNMILAQAGARAYSDRFRTLGAQL